MSEVSKLKKIILKAQSQPENTMVLSQVDALFESIVTDGTPEELMSSMALVESFLWSACPHTDNSEVLKSAS